MGAERGTTEATETTVTAASGRKIETEEPLVETHDNGTVRKYCVGGTGPEESVYESAKWSGEETEESASEEDSETAGGSREVRMIHTTTAEE